MDVRNPGKIAVLGLAWYFFYAFGLYTIQGQYTAIYVVYMAIFGLSFYSLVIGVLSIRPEEAQRYQIPKALRKVLIIFLLVIIGMLYPLWILRMLPDIAAHIPAPTYGVFILDLCLVFPAVGFIIHMLRRRKPLGNILAGNPFTPEMALISSSLTLAGLVLFIPYILKIKKV